MSKLVNVEVVAESFGSYKKGDKIEGMHESTAKAIKAVKITGDYKAPEKKSLRNTAKKQTVGTSVKTEKAAEKPAEKVEEKSEESAEEVVSESTEEPQEGKRGLFGKKKN